MFTGRTIAKVRSMTDAEMEKEGWETGNVHGNGIVLELDDGSKIISSQDPEGNGPGTLFGETADGQSVYVQP